MLPGFLWAQKTDSVATSMVPLYSVGFNGGVVGNISSRTERDDNNYWLQNFKQIDPNNKLLRDDFSKYDTLGSNSNANAIFNVFVSKPIVLNNNKWFDMELRGNLLFCSKQKEYITFKGIDTSQTKSVYSFGFKGQNIGLEICPLFYFKKLKVLNPYIGMGISIAYSYKNQLSTKYNPTGKLYDRGEWGFVPLNKNTEEEITKLKSAFSYYFNIPFGLSLKRKTKPTHISPFIDFRYGIKLEKYPAVNYTLVHAFYAQAGLKFIFFK